MRAGGDAVLADADKGSSAGGQGNQVRSVFRYGDHRTDGQWPTNGTEVIGSLGMQKLQNDIWGDTVNTVSRMESSGAPGQASISEATFERVKDEPGLVFIPRGKAQGDGEWRCMSQSGRRLVSPQRPQERRDPAAAHAGRSITAS
jgi:hypothetical protein